MNKLINNPANVVADALHGMEAAHPELRVDHEHRLVLRAGSPTSGKVGLVSGGRCGLEALHGGSVGYGMLDAACVGEPLASPTTEQVHAATAKVDAGAVVLHIVKNYTDDVTNFETAANAAFAEQGIEVSSVVVDDDVAVFNSVHTLGRRGLGGSLLVEKIAGAAAEQGRPLDQVVALARAVADRVRSMGMALTSGKPQTDGESGSDPADVHMDLGVGLHGEPGREQRPLVAAAELAELLLEPILPERDFTAGPAILYVNGLGGTSQLDLYIMYAEVSRLLAKAGVEIARSLVGSYVVSPAMTGCSVSVLSATDELLELWDAPVHTPNFRWGR